MAKVKDLKGPEVDYIVKKYRDVTKPVDDSYMCELSLVSTFDEETKKFKISEPKIGVWDRLRITPETFIGVERPMVTTVGQLIFYRLMVIDSNMQDIIPYSNIPTDANSFMVKISKLFQHDKITMDQYFVVVSSVLWLTGYARMLVPSLSEKIMVTPKATKRLRERLMKENADLIKNGDIRYVTEVEDKVLQSLHDELKDDPSFRLYDLKKPSFGNHMKQTIGTFSPIQDPFTGELTIPKGNLMEGIDVKDYNAFANMNISGTNARAVGTADGGAIVKSIYNAMSPIFGLPKGSDCKSTKYIRAEIRSDNSRYYIGRYIIEKGDTLVLTEDNISKYIGKTVRMRDPQMCMCEEELGVCNVCLGDLMYDLDMAHDVGNLCAAIGFKFVNLNLNQFHDSTISVNDVNPVDYMKIIK